MICCGYCKMRLSRCQCPKAKPKEKRRKTKPAYVEPPKGQSTIHLKGSPRVQLRWWGQNAASTNLLKTDDKTPRRGEDPKV